MKDRIKLILLSMVAALFAVFTLGAFGSTAQAATVPITGNTAADATMTFADSGSTASASDIIYDWQGVNVSYKFSVADGVPINAGDTATFTLPSNVVAKNNLTFDVKDNNGTVIGYFTIQQGATTGTLTFNQNASQAHLNRAGSLTITAAGSKATDTNPNNFIINKNGWIPNQKTLTGSPTTLTWNVAFNNPAATLTHVKIADTLGPNQTYVNGSVVANTGYYLNGQFISTGTIEPQSVLIKGNQLIFVFGNVSQTVNMTYQVTVPEADASQINNWTNNVTLQSDQVTEDASHTITWGGTGTGTGDVQNGDVILTKTNSVTGDAVPGATFELLDAVGNVIKDNLVSDNNGQIALTDLPTGDYVLVETGFPVGYYPSADNEYPFTITPGQTTPVAISATNVPYPEDDELSTGGLVLVKTDATSKEVLAGAKYNLYDVNNQLITTETTNEKGEISFDGLQPGDYTLVEQSAPEGYQVDATPIKVTITADKTETVFATDQKTATENPGTTPEEPGTTPENPGTTPENPGTTPENPGTTPENPGTTPEQPGTTPENPGTTPEEPSVVTPGTNPSGSTPADETESSASANEKEPATSAENGTSVGQGILPGTPAAESASSSDKQSAKNPADSLNHGKLPQTGNMISIFAIIVGIILVLFIIVKLLIKENKI